MLGIRKELEVITFIVKLNKICFFNTNAEVLEDDYMKSNKARSDVDLRDLDETLTTT